ncbi:MAG: hypothetical protein ACRD1X_14195 [Vicinamibacteria bacterium]
MKEARGSASGLALCAALMAASCLPIYRTSQADIAPAAPGYESAVQVRFLGVGGFLIRRGSDAVLTAPLYTNPSETELGGPLAPNPDRIAMFHPPSQDVKAIFVGHAHYDHLMDVPYVWKNTPDAMIYGNESTKNILAGYSPAASVPAGVPVIPPEKVRALNSSSDNVVDYRMCLDREGLGDDPVTEDASQGRWVDVPGARVRFRALCSEHPPQIAGMIHLWPGAVLRPRFRPPDNAMNYLQGETHAFLIDFMNEEGTVPEFRIYYQDAPTNVPIGEVHPSLLEEKRVDLALLCVGNFFDVASPTHIVTNTHPRYVILGHWENFFRAQNEELKGLPLAGSVVKAVQEAAPDALVYLPAPQTVFQFSPEGVEP